MQWSKERNVRVLMVSIGALENGPIAPLIRPIPICWYEGNSCPSNDGCNLCASFFNSWYAVKFAPTQRSQGAPHRGKNCWCPMFDTKSRHGATYPGSWPASTPSTTHPCTTRPRPPPSRLYILHAQRCDTEVLRAGLRGSAFGLGAGS